jgi:hypothetical protein
LGIGAASLAPAQAVSRGELDEGRHPMVGHMVAHTDAGDALWRCSGTLIDSTTFITAGHCTSDEGGGASSVDSVHLWFGDGPYVPTDDFLADVRVGDDPSCLHDTTLERYPGYPCTGERTGEAYTHPNFDPAQFWLWDLGVVKLDEGVLLGEDQYASLPEPGEYDGWKSNSKQEFTTVGYGLQKDHGNGAWWRDLDTVQRMVANPRLVSINSPALGDYGMRLSNNASTGGTCSGDSGGPNFVGDSHEIAGVTSYGMTTQTCGGIGGVYRTDRQEDRAWLECVRAAPDEVSARACSV